MGFNKPHPGKDITKREKVALTSTRSAGIVLMTQLSYLSYQTINEELTSSFFLDNVFDFGIVSMDRNYI